MTLFFVILTVFLVFFSLLLPFLYIYTFTFFFSDVDPNCPEAVATTIKALTKPLIKVDINGNGTIKMFSVESQDTFHDLCLRVAEKAFVPPEEAEKYYLFIIATNETNDSLFPSSHNTHLLSFFVAQSRFSFFFSCSCMAHSRGSEQSCDQLSAQV